MKNLFSTTKFRRRSVPPLPPSKPLFFTELAKLLYLQTFQPDVDYSFKISSISSTQRTNTVASYMTTFHVDNRGSHALSFTIAVPH